MKMLKTALILINILFLASPCYALFGPSLKLFNKTNTELKSKITGIESRIDKVENKIIGIDKSLQAGRDNVVNEKILFYWIISALVAIVGLLLKDRRKLRKDLLRLVDKKRTFKAGYYELKKELDKVKK